MCRTACVSSRYRAAVPLVRVAHGLSAVGPDDHDPATPAAGGRAVEARVVDEAHDAPVDGLDRLEAGGARGRREEPLEFGRRGAGTESGRVGRAAERVGAVPFGGARRRAGAAAGVGPERAEAVAPVV